MATTSRSSLTETARAVVEGPGAAVAARVVELKGFSTWPGDEMVVVDEDGVQHGYLPGDERLRAASADLLGRRDKALRSLTISIEGPAVAEAGLACGGLAELVLQPVSTMPAGLWRRLASRAPVGLVTPLAAGTEVSSALVLPDGTVEGGAEHPLPRAVVDEASGLLRSGQGGTRRLTEDGADWLVEAWVPDPRLIVVGSGELVAALRAQAGLLGWEVTDVDGRPRTATDDTGGAGADLSWPAMAEALVWAGASGALVVLSHDPHVDVPAIGAALDADVSYLGAMGSRRTQSRRMERLQAAGRTEEQLARVHRPIGLDLGGRSAPQLALAICAEILAVHSGRDGRSLSAREGPIHQP